MYINKKNSSSKLEKDQNSESNLHSQIILNSNNIFGNIIFEQRILEEDMLYIFQKNEKLKFYKKINKYKIGKTKKNCSVCQYTIKKNQIIRLLPCKHYFHNNCIKPWLKNNYNCPLCRFDLKLFFDE